MTKAAARFAAIDLGSNSFHLIIAEKVAADRYRVQARKRQKVRLAEGLTDSGVLRQGAISRGVKCLTSFAAELSDIPPQQIKCVATATLRKASNQTAIVSAFEAALGVPIEVISGEQEARLIYQGATSAGQFDSNSHTLVLDIGGASTEAVVGQGAAPILLNSLDMGCVVWQRRFFADGVITQTRVNEAVTAAAALIEPHRQAYQAFNYQQVCGASGAFRALHDIIQQRQPQAKSSSYSAQWVADIIRETIALGHTRELHQLGLRRDRQPVFMGGVTILLGLIQQLRLEQLQLAQGALREGLLEQLLRA